jgi:two-component system NtrC family sensor kinase
MPMAERWISIPSCIGLLSEPCIQPISVTHLGQFDPDSNPKTNPVVIKQFQQVEKIEANMGEIQLAFNHLITNAFQSMNGQGGQLILSTKLLKGMIEVRVIDSGVGIPQKHLNQIFDPFFTTRNFGEGKGLGLNIVYRIMTRYGGSINVESKEGVGSAFILHFPIGRAQ